MPAFKAGQRALTVEGSSKRGMGVSEKDDRALPQSQSVLGWNHEEKIRRLTEESKVLREQLQGLQDNLDKIAKREKDYDCSLALLAQRQLFVSFERVNTALWEAKLNELKTQQAALMQQPEAKEINALQNELKQLKSQRDDILSKSAVIK